MTGHAPAPQASPHPQGTPAVAPPRASVNKRGETGRRAANDGQSAPPSPPPR
jgi:hypothetical protein